LRAALRLAACPRARQVDAQARTRVVWRDEPDNPSVEGFKQCSATGFSEANAQVAR